MLGRLQFEVLTMTKISRFLVSLLCSGIAMGAAQADTLVVEPAADTTIYEVAMGDSETANSRGVHLFAGRIVGGLRRRAMLRFDLSAIPPGSVVNSAQFSLSLTRVPPGTLPAVNFSLQPVTASWGEGSSDAGEPGGNGVLATAGDPTWAQRAFPATPWTLPGGDFFATASAVTSANGLGRYQWGSGTAMVSTVQDWVDSPANNFGWMLIADETAGDQTARRFASREATDANTRPQLSIDYTPGSIGPPAGPTGIPTLSLLGLAGLLLLVAAVAAHSLRRT
jgi:hypothetical protein